MYHNGITNVSQWYNKCITMVFNDVWLRSYSLLADYGPPSPPPPYSPPAEGKKGFGQGMGDQVDRGIQKDAADSVRPETRVPGGWFGWLLGIERLPSAKRRTARLERSAEDLVISQLRFMEIYYI